ncbi:putative damage-inducible protein DinB [Paenibacillus cellulosilyticus]|uniref:Putative damage-inducible protein DinB n=1 Tax=Paenibacillus cellulosilyticus TaxID=375489 RepID=A0A2V2Z1H6_9BACL|nr:DinB family protein [Paenibacillus cellulosilyticus]PWW08717.1 putative damage-inducible protein DinB [Paenibacillus cellulosilyticus]QKS48281.1 DinB family protein [Paenibacillus cellulosilyticus]
MYRATEDFVQDWAASAQGTLAVMKSITDDKMGQAIVEGHSTLGWLAWHLTSTAGFFGQLAGLPIPGVERGAAIPAHMADIVSKYEEINDAYAREAVKLTDEQLVEEIDAFGRTMPRGKFLRLLVDHQTHHRGQMTVLLRQAGLPVPGVLGPTREMQASK